MFVRVGLSGCRRVVAGLPGPCVPYRSSVHLVRRLVDPLGQALRGSDHGKIWAGVCPAVGVLVHGGPSQHGLLAGWRGVSGPGFVVDQCMPGVVTSLAGW